MRWIRRLLVVPLLGMALGASAQDVKIITSNLDVTDTSYVYRLYNEPIGPVTAGGVIAAVSASTTITSTTSAFTGMGVGDLISFNVAGTVTTRRITTWTDANSIAVSGANLTLSAATPFTWRDLNTGTAVDSGAFDVSSYQEGILVVDLATLNSASMEVRLECRGGGTSWTDVLSVSLAAAATAPANEYPIPEVDGFSQCRVGVKETTDASTQDLSVYFIGVR